MPDDDYSPVTLEEDEEEKRKPSADPYPPVQPVETEASGAPFTPGDASAAAPIKLAPPSHMTPAPSPNEMPPALPAGGAMPPPPNMGAPPAVTPILAPSQRPSWKEFAPPQLHGIRAFGARLAGPRFEQERMATATQGFNNATKEYEDQQADELKQQQEGRLTAAEQAKAEQEKAQAAKAGRETWKAVPGMIGPGGKVLQESDQGNMRWAPNVEGAEALKQPNEPEKEKDISDYLAANKMEDTPANRELARDKIAGRGKQEPGSFMPLYDEKGHVTGAWDPKSGRVVNGPNAQGTTAGGHAIADKATAAATKEAQPYQQMIDNATQAHELADMATKGNASADVDLVLSFFKMMRGTGGANIRFTQQEQNLILGARSAGQGLIAIGQKVIGSGQPLTPEQRENMVAVIDMHAEAAKQHLTGLQQQGNGGGAELKPPKEADPGMKWQHRTVNGKTEWQQVKR